MTSTEMRAHVWTLSLRRAMTVSDALALKFVDVVDLIEGEAIVGADDRTGDAAAEAELTAAVRARGWNLVDDDGDLVIAKLS